jgi:hypothetical protein
LSKLKQHIGDFFKKHLSGAELPLSGGKGDAIFQELHVPKKKRLPRWYWLLPLVLIGGLTFGLISYTPFGSKNERPQLMARDTKREKSKNNNSVHAPKSSVVTGTEYSKTIENEQVPSDESLQSLPTLKAPKSIKAKSTLVLRNTKQPIETNHRIQKEISSEHDNKPVAVAEKVRYSAEVINHKLQ